MMQDWGHTEMLMATAPPGECASHAIVDKANVGKVIGTLAANCELVFCDRIPSL